ncbi:AraC family transcriptional regulator [Mesorhizobium sp. M0663]
MPPAISAATTPLLRELILAFLEVPRAEAGSARAERLVAVILDQLRASPVAPLSLPSPISERLRALAEYIRNDPGADWPLDEIASCAAMSPRSLQRHFQSETSMSFRAWRQQAKLLKAVEWLAAGRSVATSPSRSATLARAPSSRCFARPSVPLLETISKSHLRKPNAPDARRGLSLILQPSLITSAED